MLRLFLAFSLLLPFSLRAAFPIGGTFFVFDRNLTPELLALEFHDMAADGLKTVVIESVGSLGPTAGQPQSCTLGGRAYSDSTAYALSPTGLLYPSRFVAPSARPADQLETVFRLADSFGFNVYLGSLQTPSDWTTGSAFCGLRQYNTAVAAEILARYGQHPSFKGWYFTQELWLNWIKYYGAGASGNSAANYYGTALLAEWAADMKTLDASRLTTASAVFKETGYGAMPGLSPSELQQWTASLLQSAPLDIFLPQDGAGAAAGAPSLNDLPAYFAAFAAAAAGTNTTLWSTLELFTASTNPNVSGAQYLPVSGVARIQSQLAAESPYVSGFVGWMFGDDLSRQATYYPVEATDLNRRYQSTFGSNVAFPGDDVLPLATYWYPAGHPNSLYPDSAFAPKLSDGTGGGYASSQPLTSWVGFSSPFVPSAGAQVIADLGAPRTVHSVQALTQSWTQAGIFHPSSMLVETSSDGLAWIPFGITSAFPSDTVAFAPMWGEVSGVASARYVRTTFSYSQWFFLAELEVIGPK